tara:strand:+ start:174 stop:458 length:285 start_codon:yes stop_codon:yes gene_type:complete
MLNMSTADNLREAKENMPTLSEDFILDFEDEWALTDFIDIRKEMWFESLAVQDQPKLEIAGVPVVAWDTRAAREIRIDKSSEAILHFWAVEARV